MKSIWDDDENISELDLVEDAHETEQLAEEYASQPSIVEAEEEDLEEIAEESAFDLDRSESNIIYNARLRLEQARLYELLINHNLFDGVEADERAVSIVQNELKHYIVKRLEILMGLRQLEPKKAIEVITEFNPVELEFLKALSYTGTKGESALVAPRTEQRQGIKPLTASTKPTGLKFISNSKTVQRAAPVQRVESPKRRVTKETSVTPTPKVKKNLKSKKLAANSIKSGTMRERKMTAAEAEEIAREDLKLMADRKKPFHKMNAKEKAEEIRRVSARHSPKPKPNNPQLPATLDEGSLMNKYMMEQSIRGNGDNKIGQINQMIASALLAQKNK